MTMNFPISNPHELAAERGEDALTFYDARMNGAEWHEKEEYAALRHCPDYLRHALSSLLTDLMCLAIKEGVAWNDLLNDAKATYEKENE